MSNRLVINPGTPQAWEIQLKPGLNRIGRGEDNDFVINHQSVSTHHCELTVADTTVTLRDLGSTNGTFVERVPVTEIQLHSGHHVQFGSVGLVFESVGLPPLPDAVNLPADGAHIMVANPTPAAPPPPPPPPGLRINRPATGASHPPTIASATTKPATPIPIRNFNATAAGAAAGSNMSDRQSLIRGSIGAIVGGLLGLFIWYFITKYTGYSFKLVALGVGALTGGAARMLAKDGSLGLGTVCGICALLAIMLGDYYGVRALFVKEVAKFASIADAAYEAQLKYAKEAVAAKTPEEIRKFIAEQEEKTPAEVTEDEIADFKKELPKLQELSDGKVSKEEFRQKLDSAVAEEFSYKEYFFEGNVKGSIFQILFICLGVATAWKIGAGDAAAD
ncbi:MAG: FHA domain-containing protein [Verrucomicrobiota bacterium]